MTAGAGNLAAGWLFLCLAALGSASTAPYVMAAAGKLGSPTLKTIAEGKWPVEYEDALAKTLPAGTFSRNFWGRAEYAAFHEGRSGVVPGADGWFFTAEEFSCPAKAHSNIAANLAFIGEIRKNLAARNTALAVIIIPAKARVYSAQLHDTSMPRCRDGLYEGIMEFFKEQKIPAAQILPAMLAKQQRENLYLKADTHWSPAGARLAAAETAQIVSALDLDFDDQEFSTQDGKARAHHGDLDRYLPGVALENDMVGTYTTSAPAAQDLFADTRPSVALVGTSYSANAEWNFDGFLKESLKTDVLNMADEGLGPMVVMNKFMANKALGREAFKLVVWEIPERYMAYPNGVAPR